MSTEKVKNKAKIDELTQELQFKSTQETVVIKEKEEQVSSQMQTHKKVVDNMSIKIDDLKEELNSEKQARIEIEEELENYQIKTDDQDNEIKNLTQKIKHLTKASQEGNKELIGLKTELDKKKDIEKQVDKYKFEQIQLKQEIEDLRNDTSEGNEAAQKAMNQLNLKDKEIDKLKQLHSKEVQAKNDQIKQHESEIDNKNNHIVLLKQETDNTQIQLQKQISDNDQKINKLNEEVKKSTEKFNQSKTKLDDLTKKLKSVESENESLKDQISNLKSTISDKEKTIVQKLESISNLEDENKNYKNYIEEYEETNNSLSDALTSCKVENGELNYKIKRLEQQIEEYENQHRNENDTSATTINNLKQRINDVNQENENLRNKVNDLKESEQRLKTEVGQYKLHVDRIKREKDEELIKIDQTKDELIEEANKQLENFDAEKHAFKAKIKSLLIEYCDLDEDSYQMGDDVDMDEYLETLEKELKGYTERVKEKSMDQVSKFIEDLESAQAQQNSLGNELTTFKKQNDELSEINTKLELTIKHLQDEMEKTEQSKQTAQKERSKFEKLSADLEKNVKFYEQINEQLELNKTELETKIENFEKSKKQLEDQIEELESELDKKAEQVLQLEKELNEPSRDSRTSELESQVLRYQEDAIKLSEKLKFTERELSDEIDKNRKLRSEMNTNNDNTSNTANRQIENTDMSDEGKEYLMKLDTIEKRVDQIKNEIGKVKVDSFDKLKDMYEIKYQQYVKRVQSKLVESDIKEKGIVNILKELKGLENDSIRVLKTITHEDKVWYLIEEDFEVDISRQEEPEQYWIRESDLTDEERDYIHEFIPSSGMEDFEDTGSYLEINNKLKEYTQQLQDLKKERSDLLKDLREIRFGLKITYYCMENNFDEDAEQKMYDQDIKIIEYEDDITYLNENLQEQKITVNQLQLKSKKQEKRIEELNGIIANISKNTTQSVDRFIESYKRANDLVHKNRELQDEINSKNDEIESMKNSSMTGRQNDFFPAEESKSEDLSKFKF